MKSTFCLPLLVFAVALAGCTDSLPQTSTDVSEAAQETANDTSGASVTLTTQAYDAASGSYGDSETQQSVTGEQIESAIRSYDWSPGPIRPIVKLVRMDAGEITAYLQIKRDQDSGDTILAAWQSVAGDNKFTRTSTLTGVEDVLRVALAFAGDDDLRSAAEWTEQ